MTESSDKKGSKSTLRLKIKQKSKHKNQKRIKEKKWYKKLLILPHANSHANTCKVINKNIHKKKAHKMTHITNNYNETKLHLRKNICTQKTLTRTNIHAHVVVHRHKRT